MRVIRSESLLHHPPLRIVEDTLEDEGRQFRRTTVEHPGAVVLIAVVEGRLLFVRQYRHAARGPLLELPAGTLEEGETPEETAKRELREETGFRPGRLRRLGSVFAAPGYSSERLHFFWAAELREDPLEAPEEEPIELVRLELGEALAMAADGRFEDAKTALGLLWVGQLGLLS